MIYKLIQFWFSLNEKIRFLLVGGYNTAFAYLLFCILEFWLSARFSYLLLLCIAHFISVINSFFSFRIFVFQSKGKIFTEYLRVNLVYLLYLLFNSIMLYLLNTVVGMNLFIAQFICIAVLSIIFYLIHKFFSFTRYV